MIAHRVFSFNKSNKRFYGCYIVLAEKNSTSDQLKEIVEDYATVEWIARFELKYQSSDHLLFSKPLTSIKVEDRKPRVITFVSPESLE